jgi:hypothetical protein
MLREYIREHALSLPIGGLVIRPESSLSSTALISLFALMMVPYFVLVMPQLFGDAHLNSFKASAEPSRTLRPMRARCWGARVILARPPKCADRRGRCGECTRRRRASTHAAEA